MKIYPITKIKLNNNIRIISLFVLDHGIVTFTIWPTTLITIRIINEK